jgi:hypothetical protein
MNANASAKKSEMRINFRSSNDHRHSELLLVTVGIFFNHLKSAGDFAAQSWSDARKA